MIKGIVVIVELEQGLSLISATLLGGAIGFEREIHGKSAGLRTNILICLGAAAFTIVSGSMGGSPQALGRVTAAVVTGVGFLGAGVLIHEGSGVHGLTTAAGIWVVASIGIACGSGMYFIALLTTLLVLLVLMGLSPFTRRIRKKYRKARKHPEAKQE